MTAWKSVQAKKIHEELLERNLKAISEVLFKGEAIQVLPLPATTEVGDHGITIYNHWFLILWGTPAKTNG